MSANNYSKRSKARFYALQALYGWSISGNELLDIDDYFLTERSQKKFDVNYFQLLLHEIPTKKSELDEYLSAHMDLKNIADTDPIEHAILWIACFEMFYRDDVPVNVVINESIELAKKFGAEGGHKFINGVLDSLAKKHKKHKS